MLHADWLGKIVFALRCARCICGPAPTSGFRSPRHALNNALPRAAAADHGSRSRGRAETLGPISAPTGGVAPSRRSVVGLGSSSRLVQLLGQRARVLADAYRPRPIRGGGMSALQDLVPSLAWSSFVEIPATTREELPRRDHAALCGYATVTPIPGGLPVVGCGVRNSVGRRAQPAWLPGAELSASRLNHPRHERGAARLPLILRAPIAHDCAASSGREMWRLALGRGSRTRRRATAPRADGLRCAPGGGLRLLPASVPRAAKRTCWECVTNAGWWSTEHRALGGRSINTVIRIRLYGSDCLPKSVQSSRFLRPPTRR